MKITQERLDEIIASHGKWLRDEEGGERANLSNAYLSNANLRNANLCGANFNHAYLSGADLRGADLRDAYLSDANLRGADLDKTYYQVVRIGSRRGTTTYCVDDDNVLCGCWNNYKGGTLEEFKTRVESVYGREDNNPNEQYYDEYMAAITFFAAMKEITA